MEFFNNIEFELLNKLIKIEEINSENKTITYSLLIDKKLCNGSSGGELKYKSLINIIQFISILTINKFIICEQQQQSLFKRNIENSINQLNENLIIYQGNKINIKSSIKFYKNLIFYTNINIFYNNDLKVNSINSYLLPLNNHSNNNNNNNKNLILSKV